MKSKNCVLVCVTPQSKCEQLIRSGSLIAQQYGVPLEVLSVFHERDGFSPDPAVLEDLYECAKNENAQMSVYFNDSPAILAAVIAKKKGAVDIVTGFPKERSTHFVSALHTLVPDIQISMVDVDDNGKIYRMIPQEAQPHYEMVGAQGVLSRQPQTFPVFSLLFSKNAESSQYHCGLSAFYLSAIDNTRIIFYNKERRKAMGA